MSIELKTISFRNFMSFGNSMTEVSLSSRGTTHIIGKNLDKGGSSGSGKTSIINAICYALYDKTPSNIGKERLINSTNSSKNTLMEVILNFIKDNKDEYTIRRTRGEVSSITVLKGDKDITPDSVINTNRFIEELIGISYDLFTRVVLFSGNAQPFLDLPVHEQRQLIEELLKITMLSSKANALKEDIKSCEKDIEISKIHIKQQEAQNKLHQKHVSECEIRLEKWELQNLKDIESINKQLNSILDIDMEVEEQKHNLIKTLKDEIRKLTLEINPRVNNKSNLEIELSKLKKELIHLQNDNCPYCLQKYPNANIKRDQILSNIEEKKIQFKDVSSNIDLLEEELKIIKNNLKETEKTIKYENFSEAIKIHSNKENLNENLLRLNNNVNPHIEAYESLLNEKEIVIDYDKLNELDKTLDHQKFLLKLLTDKNSFIRKKIISKTIPFLNKRISYYINELGLPHSVSFLSDMSCEIMEFGRELDHGNLSAGEQKRLNLSLSLAFRDVLTHLHSPINTMFCDETDGGSLSGEDIDRLIRLLKHVAWDTNVCLYAISHRPEFEGRCDFELLVQKENGFSSIIENNETEV